MEKLIPISLSKTIYQSVFHINIICAWIVCSIYAYSIYIVNVNKTKPY